MRTPRLILMLLVGLSVAALVTTDAEARSVAYNFSPGQGGNQGFGGELGNDFTVNVPIRVTEMGVFDDLSNGIAGALTSQIWTRSGNTGTLVPGTTMGFTNASPGALEGCVRLKPLPSPVILPVGTYTFASNGHSGADRNLNSNIGGFLRYADNGYGAVTSGPATAPGLITIQGAKRYGATANTFPNVPNGNWLFGSGTFAFEQAYPTAYTVQNGAVGNQAFDGSLGMDFRTYRPTMVTHLGVFDSSQDGLNRAITARLYERGPGNTGTELASVTLSGTDGQLIGGTRYVPLATPLYLPRGFDGTMVAEGYGAGEPLLNSHGGAPTMWATYSGDGVVSFVGSGRWGTAGLFPTNADGGPVDRYAAGSFMFQPVGDPLPIGSIQPVPVANGSFESPVRPQQPAGGYWGPADNWTHVGPAGGGHFHPAATIFTDPIPDGNQVAYVNAGSIISDPLPGPGLEADTLYILDVDWGHRTDTPGTLYHSMTLRAGGVPLGWLNDSNMRKGPPVGPGQFEQNRAYFTANHNAAIGSPLDIKLDGGAGGQAIYDNVRVTKFSNAALLVENGSFEMDAVATNDYKLGAIGWQHTTSPNAGIVDMASQITAADGQQCAFVEHGGSLTQTLTGMTLEPFYRYILLAEVADRASTPFAGYGLELLAGGEVVAADIDTKDIVETQAYFYVTAVVDVLIEPGDPLIGEELGIRLTAPIAGGHAYYDNVRLFAAYIPEPTTLALLGLGGLTLLRRRRR